ncbi:uncharacterized protein DNG_00251 [Cephalotrichum gorgonifer]|uniref:Uncharacterized protein n=1 Tax=Cephalotrichum gorgonifer TaxID=2041049 RepID=A0AAE8MQV2_9PEZI|nr:uncharacterized protein DNG_00251 [Cephalotrichum gorgonifer]
MCVDIIQYTVCNHKSRHFTQKCRSVRNVGCFEPIYAFFFGPRSKSPCTLPMVPGKVDPVEGWCSRMCRLKYERLDPRNFRGRSPCEYLRERLGRTVKEEWARREAETNRIFQSPYSEQGYDRGYGGLEEARETGWTDARAKSRSATYGDSRRTFGEVAAAREGGGSLDWPVRGRPEALPTAHQGGGYRSDGDTAGKGGTRRSRNTNLPARGRKSEEYDRKPEVDTSRADAPGPSRSERARVNVRAADLLRDGRHVDLAGNPANQPPPPKEQKKTRLSGDGKGGTESGHNQGKGKKKVSMLPRTSQTK